MFASQFSKDSDGEGLSYIQYKTQAHVSHNLNGNKDSEHAVI